ncbi:MAG: hypothetical protein GY948_04030 [Alphaproteobacteria bacterium]|nr:hypothetical protein [Alphaproteobacteria bacterium]
MAAPGRAQSSAEEQELKKLLNSKPYVNKLRFVVSRYEASVNGCKAPNVVGRTGLTLLDARVPMPGIGVPASAQWMDVVGVKGCGKPYQRRVVGARHKGQTVMFPYLSGSTRTTPVVQFETMRLVLNEERKHATAAGCKAEDLVSVATTRFVASAKAEHGTMWRESWTVKSCKGVRNVGLQFAPDKNGHVAVTLE